MFFKRKKEDLKQIYTVQSQIEFSSTKPTAWKTRASAIEHARCIIVAVDRACANNVNDVQDMLFLIGQYEVSPERGDFELSFQIGGGFIATLRISEVYINPH